MELLIKSKEQKVFGRLSFRLINVINEASSKN